MKLTLRQKPLKDNRISLYLEVYHKGKRTFEFLNLYLEEEAGTNKRQIAKLNKETLELANKIYSKRIIELSNSEYGFITSSMLKKNFYDYWNIVASNKKGFTTRSYNQTLRYVKEYSKQADYLALEDITPEWIENFVKFLSKSISDNSINLYLSKIKVVFTYLESKDIVLKNPFKKAKIELTKKQSKRNYLTFDELEKLSKIEVKTKSDYEYFLSFLFTAYTGIRYSDIIRLIWRDVNFNDNTLSIVQQKTKETLYIDLNDTAVSILNKVKNIREYSADDRIFKCFKSNITTTANGILQRMIDKAGIEKNISFHCLRHSFATNFISAGGDLYILMVLLGHKDIKTTQIYAKVLSQRRKEAVKLFPMLDIKERAC